MYFSKRMPALLGAQLRDTADYNCIGSICYGIGPYDTTMQTVQTYINYFAKVAGFSPIAVDGKIGSDTVDAYNQVVAYLMTDSTAVSNGHATQLAAFSNLNELIAADAPSIVSILQDEISRLGLTPNAPTVVTTVGTTLKNLVTNPVATVKSRPWPWAIGAGLVVAAAAGAYYLYEG